MAIEFHCDLSNPGESLPHFWEHTVGSCHAPLALRADWQSQLRRCHNELGFQYVRFHGLLCDDMGTLIRHKDQPLYSFFNADQIMDFLLSIGMRPFVELSFMPEILASGPTTVFKYRGNITPPKDQEAWGTLIRKLVAHWVDRYGVGEVRHWFFEVWNEPNLQQFWTGTQDDYFELYRHTARAIKEVDPTLRVGGPATAKNEWIDGFLDFCEREHLPADFVSTHQYPNDVLWSEEQDTERQLANSQRSILRSWAEEAHRQARGRPLYYTEWNISSNPRYPRQDDPYAAAFAIKTIMEMAGLVEVYSFWTFSDIFEENYFPSVPFHGGFGMLNLHGIPKPTYRAFELLHRLGSERFPVDGSHETVDAWVIRNAQEGVTVLLTNHALPRHPIQIETVRVRFAGSRRPRIAYVERIDEGHANPKRMWLEMGAREYLSKQDVERLEEASKLSKEPIAWQHENSATEFTIILPPHSVVAVTLR